MKIEDSASGMNFFGESVVEINWAKVIMHFSSI